MKKTLLFLMCSCLAFLLQANPYGSQGCLKFTAFSRSQQWQTHSTALACMVAQIMNNKRALSPKSIIAIDREENYDDSNQMSKRRVSFSDEHNHESARSSSSLRDCIVKSPSPAPTPTKDAEMVVVGLAIRRPSSIADSSSNLQDCIVYEGSPSPKKETDARDRSYSSDSNSDGYFLKHLASDDQFNEFYVSPGTPARRKRIAPMAPSYSYGSNEELIKMGMKRASTSQVLQDHPTPTLVPSPKK